MAQSSGPISQGTDAERQFTDVMWRDLFGDEPGVVGDISGAAYQLTLPTNSDVAQIGSATQDSVARLAGFAHRIPAGQPESITIPAASGTAQTSIVALRYDPAYTGAPGPVRLIRIAGTSASLPAYDSSPPGVEDLPLWAVTRQPNQALSQATVLRIFPRLAPVLDVPVGAALPLSSPLGTRLHQGANQYVRQLGGAGAPTWVNVTPATAPANPDTTPAALTLTTAFQHWGFGYRNLCYWRTGSSVHVVGSVRLLTAMPASTTRVIATLPAGFRPAGQVDSSGITTYARTEVLTNGQIRFNNNTFGVTLAAGTLVAVNMVVPLD